MSEITITILGSTAGVPTLDRAHSSVHLESSDKRNLALLFDCGEGTQRQLLRAKINYLKIDHIFISHWHGDHCLGLAGLTDTMGFEKRKSILSIYGPEKGMIDKEVERSHSMAEFPIKKVVVSHERDEPEKIFEDESSEIFSVSAKHSVPAVSYVFKEKDKKRVSFSKAQEKGLPRISELFGELEERGSIIFKGEKIFLDEVSEKVKGKKIVYSGDTEISENLSDACDGADVLIQDCTYFKKPKQGKQHQHASLPEILSLREKGEIKKIVLTHISRKYSDIEKLKSMVPDDPSVLVAEDLMELRI